MKNTAYTDFLYSKEEQIKIKKVVQEKEQQAKMLINDYLLLDEELRILIRHFKLSDKQFSVIIKKYREMSEKELKQLTI